MSEFTQILGEALVKKHPVVNLGSSYKGYTGYREELGGKDDIGGPNQANLGALAFILWCSKSISE